MIRQVMIVAAAGLTAISYSSAGFAQEKPKEVIKEKRPASENEQTAILKKRIHALQMRIKDLHAANQPDEAEKVERELQALLSKVHDSGDIRDNVHRKIEELLNAGRVEEAKELKGKLGAEIKSPHGFIDKNAKHDGEAAKHFQQVHEKMELEMQAIQRKLEELAKEGRHEEAEKVARFLRERQEEMHKVHAQHGVHMHGKSGEGISEQDRDRRIEHLMQAAEHLTAAGLAEQGMQLRKQADMIRAQAREGAPSPPEFRELQTQIRHQNERLERLEQMIQKLIQHVEKEQHGLPGPKILPERTKEERE